MKKKIYAALAVIGLAATYGCKDFLDVNTNPNGPEKVSPNLYLASMESNLALGVQFDARYMGKYVQNFVAATANDVWDQQGYIPASDAGGQLWRNVYWKLGYNAEDMINLSLAQQRWDLAGIGYVLKAWGWQNLTDMHGEIIIKEAYISNKSTFNYDSQEFAYSEVKRLCDSAALLFNRTDGVVNTAYTAKGDIMYKGDKAKWVKFMNGLLAMNAHHLSNKASYSADKVIEYVDKALASNSDDAMMPFAATVSDDANFFGPMRNNMGTFIQSEFAVNSMNGTVFGGVVDPRLPLLLVKADDGQYHGLKPTAGNKSVTADKVPYTLWGTKTLTAGQKGKFLFDNAVGFPLMTYAQLQFIKAEAAFKKDDFAMALDAYKKGISAHFDFVNKFFGTADQITTDAKAAYMANTNIVPSDAGTLTLKQIMMQKYIAQFGWGFIEQWCDMRRHHYNSAIFEGFAAPSTLYPDNGGKVVYRLRPRYNSEYVWNIEALKAIGATQPDYHTKEMWFTQP